MSVHIAEIDFADFFRGAFQNPLDAVPFVNQIEKIPASQSKAKVVIHQAARLLWLADRVDEVALGRPALLVMFYLIAAEAVAKMVFGFEGEGKSRHHVRLFFQDICSDQHRQQLGRAFLKRPGRCLTALEAVDLLYKVRCDVVHEWQYLEFMLPDGPQMVPVISTVAGAIVEARISAGELRQIVLEGSLLGAARILPPDSSARALVQLPIRPGCASGGDSRS